jgi:hypothetical protein
MNPKEKVTCVWKIIDHYHPFLSSLMHHSIPTGNGRMIQAALYNRLMDVEMNRVLGTRVNTGSRLIVRARPGNKESQSVIKYAGTGVFEVMQIDREANEVLLEACLENPKKRLKTAMWVSADDPRFVFEREV